MNILILVGIFLLALIAIVAVVLLVMGERETANNAGNSATANPLAMPVDVANGGARTWAGGEAGRSGRSTATHSLSGQGPNAATGSTTSTAMPAATSVPSSGPRTFPSQDRESFPHTETQEEADRSSLDGQFRELSTELRALYTRTQEMEQRISVLMEIVNRLEHDRGGLLDLDLDSEG